MVKVKFIFAVFISLIFINLASAWVFNGTVRNIDGIPLNNTLINITIWQMGGSTGMSLVGVNRTTSNASGWFNLSVAENEDWRYKPVLTLTNASTGAIDYMGQSLPEFPYREFSRTSDINFYLSPAGTINITAINRTGSRITFRYQVKDTKLGYPIASAFETPVSEANIYVPRNRNYSIMIYPDQALPVSFNWNNFSSNSSYTIVTNLATYNVTTHNVQKTFNTTDNLIRLTGYIQNTSGGDFADWNEFTVVPYLLEPGNMIYLGDNAGMPYNMSAWMNQGDEYNKTLGYYNITIPGPAESATYILFATARNGSGYYGGYKNITLSYSSTSNEVINITMYPLMATNWGSTEGNITLNDAVSWGKVNISCAKKRFNLLNSSGNLISNLNAHLEVKVDYTNYGATEFTFMSDLSSGNASFYLPLLNASVKEINIYSQSYSPKRVGTKTVAQLLGNSSNITMTAFNPGDIDGRDIAASVQVALYKSNSTCDLPNPDSSCILANSATMNPDSADRFNPLNSVIGGGKINFRMGLLSSGIIVEYINVDMLASGPPDALFDDSATTSTSGNFDSAMRFGSNGPTIYDYVIISMPYTEGSTTVTGLNESMDVNMSIPLLYDEDWHMIWNASANGTAGGALAGNQTHYSTYSNQWQILMGSNNCTRNQSEFNLTHPCYFDTTNNRIWIRLPHFSGTKPSVSGGVITATTPVTTPSGGGSSSGGGVFVQDWSMTYGLEGSDLASAAGAGGISTSLGSKQRARINISNQIHYVGVVNITGDIVSVQVSSETQKADIKVGENAKFDLTADNYYDLKVSVISINQTSNKAQLKIDYIHEAVPVKETAPVSEGTEASGEGAGGETKSGDYSWIWISLMVIVLLIIIVAIIHKLISKNYIILPLKKKKEKK